MKFNINDYKGEYVMHCKTKEEAKDFLLYLNKIGKQWRDKSSYSSRTCWNVNGLHTVYYFNKGTYGNMIYVNRDYTILEWSDFMNGKFTKADLKTGDVVMRRNGWVEIVNSDLDMLITKDGWNDMKDTREDLTDKQGNQYDIVAVRRPLKKSDCQFNAFQCEWGTLVYERKEVEEMTLAEVCRLLGKEVKIVK